MPTVGSRARPLPGRHAPGLRPACHAELLVADLNPGHCPASAWPSWRWRRSAWPREERCHLFTVVNNLCWAARAPNALLAISDSGLAPPPEPYDDDGNDDTLFVAADPHGISGPTANPLNRQHRAASQLIQPQGANSNDQHPATIPSQNRTNIRPPTIPAAHNRPDYQGHLGCQSTLVAAASPLKTPKISPTTVSPGG